MIRVFRVFAIFVVVACATYEHTGLLQRKVARNKAPFFFIHIPKCAGDSFMADARHSVSPTPFLNNRERCLADRNSGDDQILAIVLRNPVKHVLSQFLHCKYAHPANWRDPAFPSAPGVYDGFEEWITHFLQLKDRQQTMATSTSTTKQAKQAFSCYNPWNMQTRYLTSKEEDRARGCPNVLCPCHVASVLELKKNIHLGKHVIQHLVNFVGIADLYVESLCLFCISAAMALCPSPVLVVG